MARRVKTLLITGTISSEGGWEPDTLAEYPDELDLDEYFGIKDDWAAEGVAEVVAVYLRSTRHNHTYSTWPDWRANGSYMREAYTDSTTGYREEASARLLGFSLREAQLVYAKVFGGMK